MFEDLEKEYANDKSAAPFGQSINKEILQQSRKEIADQLNTSPQKADVKPMKKSLQIEIDENSDYEEQNQKVQSELNDNLQKLEEKVQAVEADGDEEVQEEDVLKEFDQLYQNDAELQQMLGEYPERYTVEEKLSIVQAYKKGGGVAGLADIIDDDDSQEEQATNQGGQGANQENRGSVVTNNEDEEEDVDIDLEDPEDVKIIEQEFKKLYEKDDDFRTNFGEEAFELGPL